MTLTVWEKAADGTPLLRESKPYLVMDGACALETFTLKESRWAKRSTSVKFSDLGALTSYSSSADSSAAAVADTLGSLGGTVGDSLETAVKINTQLDALRSHGADQQLAKLKQQVDAKQQEITLAGLAVTEKDSAELERLKQQAAILEQRKAIAGDPAPSAADQQLAALDAQAKLLDAQRALSVSQRKLTAETDLAALRLDTERREAQAEHDK